MAAPPAETETLQTQTGTEPAASVAADPSEPYARHTDVELTELAANWENLNNDQRRALLTEVQHRMAADKAKAPIITIKTRRRYGRTYRRSDGALVRIQTTEQVLQYHRPPGAVPPGEGHKFGVGFERRVAEETRAPSEPPVDAEMPPGSLPPVISVSSESR